MGKRLEPIMVPTKIIIRIACICHLDFSAEPIGPAEKIGQRMSLLGSR
jgi:hypothetical protein